MSAKTHPFVGAFGPDGTTGTTFSLPGSIGFDQSSGDVYVADIGANSVYKFGPEGETRNFSALGSNKLEGFGFRVSEQGTSEIAVNSTSHDFYVASIGTNSVFAFHSDGTPAEFSALGSSQLSGGFVEVCGVAVDPSGYIYVGDYKQVLIFKPSGELVTTFPVSDKPFGESCNVAVNSTGSVYVNRYRGNVEKFVPSTGLPPTASTTYGSAGVVDGNETWGIAVDPATDDLYADERNAIVQYKSNGTKVGTSGLSGEGQLTESQGVAIQGSTGKLFAADAASKHVKRYGPPVPEKPRVEDTWATGITATEATLHAEVVPDVDSTYWFEYGDEDCASSSCAATAHATLPEGGAGVQVSAQISGLAPNHQYHFRVVAENVAGTTFGSDSSFRSTGQGGNDGRAFELVSPPDKNSADLGVPATAGGLLLGGVKPQPAAENGESISYESFTAFADPAAGPAGSSYLSRRTPGGWTTENITPPDSTSLALIAPLRGFTPDLSLGAVVSPGQPLAPGALPEGYENLYLRDTATGAYQALTTGSVAYASKTEFCVNYIDASEGSRHVIFTASGGLTPDAPPPYEGTAETGKANLYDWSPTAGLKLVNIGPDGTPLSPTVFSGFGRNAGSCFGGTNSITRNPISADGSTIFWSRYEFEPNLGRELFARIDRTRTIKLNENQGGVGPGYGAQYLFANVEGTRAFFTNDYPLVPEAGGDDLYEYDLTSETLTDLTVDNAEPEGSRVEGITAASDDGSYFYFVARGALATGAVPGKLNLYLAHGEEIRHIAVLQQGTDSSDFVEGADEQTAKASADGRYLTFQSTRQLTAYDNRHASQQACVFDGNGAPEGDRLCMEVYRYDAVEDSILCVSCNPTNSRPDATPRLNGQPINSLPHWSTPYEQPRYLSPDGSRLFFESAERLVPGDTNDRIDVYEWEEPGVGSCTSADPSYSPINEGCVQLVSGGTGGDRSYFIDASLSGDDVFFSSRERLVRADPDENFDVYDARVGGGFPDPLPPPPSCEGEGCRGSGTQPGSGAGAGTAVFQGPGNPKAVKKCAKGKVKRHGKCVKRHKPHHPRRRHHKKSGKSGSADRPSRAADNGRAR